MIDIRHGDCLEVLRAMPDCSVDSVVTDPPYGLSFMGKKWDYDVPTVEVWVECLRVLKPGGHLLAFAGTRTQHRMAVRIEDAGFEIRDMIAWVYGSGFPKSMDVSKAIDKAAGAEREKVPASGGLHKNRNLNDDGWSKIGEAEPTMDSALPATPEAQQWAGWGTALKPALEPITVARKPLVGTVAANVLEHGTGAINVDGGRVVTEDSLARPFGSGGISAAQLNAIPRGTITGEALTGRWPANLIHDGSDEVVGLFPQSAGQQGALTGDEPSSKTANAFGEFAGRSAMQPRGDAGSAARFFYCAKASKADRSDGNTHPTVKPTDLMRYLCRLVTPPGGVVLDPFCGSGSTGKAAVLEGFQFIGIERDPQYVEIARARVAAARREPKQTALI